MRARSFRAGWSLCMLFYSVQPLAPLAARMHGVGTRVAARDQRCEVLCAREARPTGQLDATVFFLFIRSFYSFDFFFDPNLVSPLARHSKQPASKRTDPFVAVDWVQPHSETKSYFLRALLIHKCKKKCIYLLSVRSIQLYFYKPRYKTYNCQ